jgi:integrase
MLLRSIDMSKSSRSKRQSKPAKPHPDFPLFPHSTRRWCKKIRGKFHYFGSTVADPQGRAALELWLAQKDALLAGRVPRTEQDGQQKNVQRLCDHFLHTKTLKVKLGELSPHTYNDYLRVCRFLKASFGGERLIEDLTAADFTHLLAKMTGRGPVARGNLVNRTRIVFRWGYESQFYDKPIRFGPDFKRPSKKDIRLAKARKGPRMFEAAELRVIIDAAKQPLKAMILLGANCGFGTADVGRLPLAALDLEGAWVNYHREKTGIVRRCPLWPETVAALRDAIDQRPAPKEDGLADRVFVTAKGGSWFKETSDNPVSKEMAKLLKKLGINGQRNFYCLRHGFETVGGDSRDQVAVNHIMGHSDASMAAVYRERISDERLLAVVNHVRGWLFSVT